MKNQQRILCGWDLHLKCRETILLLYFIKASVAYNIECECRCNGGQCEVTRAPDGELCDGAPGAFTNGGLCFNEGDVYAYRGCGCADFSCEGYPIEGDPSCYSILCSVGSCYDIPSPIADLPGSCASDNYSICDGYTCLSDGECVEGNVQACGPPEAASCQAFQYASLLTSRLLLSQCSCLC